MKEKCVIETVDIPGIYSLISKFEAYNNKSVSYVIMNSNTYFALKMRWEYDLLFNEKDRCVARIFGKNIAICEALEDYEIEVV